MIHVLIGLGAAIRPGTQHKLEVTIQPAQCRVGIAVGDRHQRETFTQRFQGGMGCFRYLDAAAPQRKVLHRRIGAVGGFGVTQPLTAQRQMDSAPAPLGDIVINLRILFAQLLAQAMKIRRLEVVQPGMVVLQKRHRLQLGLFDHRPIVIQRVVQIKSQRRQRSQRTIKMHQDFPRLARGCAASYTFARC
ncbi:hypothetical protein D3C78_1215840 [compost metagenome]